MKTLIIFCALKEEIDFSILNPDIKIIFTGIGKVNSAIKAFENLQNFINPNNIFVLSVGTAGSNRKDTIQIGDIHYCKYFIQRDCNVEGYPQKEYHFSLPDKFDSICNSGDNFHDEPIDSNIHMLFEMEAYAIAAVCEYLGIKHFGAIKIVSDIVGENSQELWRDKIKPLSTKLTEELNIFYKNFNK